MKRITPDKSLRGKPCSIVAVKCALGPADKVKDVPELKADGYASLASANKYIRKNLAVKSRINFRRGERPKLKDLHLEGKAIVCVYGHFLYLDHEQYWSFFNNQNDDVVAMWILA